MESTGMATPECGRSQVLAPALSGEGDVESRPAERGVIHPDLAAVAVHDFGHHGEANPLAGELSARTPRWKICCDLPGSMPGPSSSTTMSRPLSRWRT